MTDWTTERIAAVRRLIDGCPAGAEHLHTPSLATLDLADAAEIGLAVIEARPETVERVARRHYETEHPADETPIGGLSRYCTWDELPKITRAQKIAAMRAALAAEIAESGRK